MPESLVGPRDALEDGQKSQRLSHVTRPSEALYLKRERRRRRRCGLRPRGSGSLECGPPGPPLASLWYVKVQPYKNLERDSFCGFLESLDRT